jgi:hypothetical protein
METECPLACSQEHAIGLIPNQMYPVHIVPYILIAMSVSPFHLRVDLLSSLFLFGLPIKMFYTSYIFHACYMSRTPRFPLYRHSN